MVKYYLTATNSDRGDEMNPELKEALTQHSAPQGAYVAVNQLRKAQRLAPVMIAAGADAAHCFGEENSATRRLAEQVAGVGESSIVTWSMVAELMS